MKGRRDRESAAELPRVALGEPEDDLAALLRKAQLLIIKYPLAAQAVFRAFVAEGRRFGETAEGQRWREELRGSDLVRRGRVVWEVGTLNVLEEESESALPSKLVDVFVRATAVRALEPFLSRIFEPGGLDEADDGRDAR
jgi:hypothetical protein